MAKGVNEIDKIYLYDQETARDDGRDEDVRFINCYPEVLSDNERYVVKRPGLKASIALDDGTPTGVARGCFYWDGNVYSAYGNQIYRGAAEIGGTDADLLSLTTGRIYWEVTNDNSKLLIHEIGASNALHTVTTAGSSLTTNVDATFTGLTTEAGIIQLDGYTFVLDNVANIWNSDLNDETTFDDDAFLNANLVADVPMAIARHNNYLMYFGSKSTEFFRNANNISGSPLGRLKGTGVLIGCACAASVVNVERTVFWIAQAHGGGRFVAALEGLQPVSVSTKPVEEILNSTGTDMTTSFAYTTRVGGHSFYIIYVEDSGGDTVLAYDITEGEWIEFTNNTTTPFDTYAATSGLGVTYMQAIGTGLTKGEIYEFDSNTFQDDSADFTCEGHTIRWNGRNTRNKFLNRLTVVGDMHTVDTTDLSLSWSDNDYTTFVTDRTIDLNDEQAFITRLGRTRRRSFRYKFRENAPMRLEYFEVDYSTGGGYGL